MSLSNDLLEQARHLAALDAGRPKQANLRRANSASYYALFHFLIWEAVQIVPAKPAGLRDRVCRAFQHGEMKQICWLFRQGNPSPAMAALIHVPLTAELVYVATTFISLQELRHSADYDRAAMFYRQETLQNIRDAEAAMAAWGKIRTTDEATVFLAALIFGSRWSK